MHFRHFIITGLMACAAVFLPNHTFAEKSDFSGQQISQNAAVQANTSIKIVHTDVQREKNEVVIEAGVNKIAPSPATSKKPIAAPQNSVEQTKGKDLSVVRKTEKAVFAPPGHEKVESVKEEAIVKNEPNPQKRTENSAIQALHHPDIEMENKAKSERSVDKTEPQLERANVPIFSKNEHFERFIPEPLNTGKLPVSKEKLPEINQEMNPTHRTSSSGGESNDRVSHGLSTINWIDIWFKWDRNIPIKLVHPYHSRNALINNQWTKAPPSPPPQGVPFLEV